MPGRYARARREVTAALVRNLSPRWLCSHPAPRVTQRGSGVCVAMVQPPVRRLGGGWQAGGAAGVGRPLHRHGKGDLSRKNALLFLSCNEFNQTRAVKDGGRERGIFQEHLLTAFGDRVRPKAQQLYSMPPHPILQIKSFSSIYSASLLF